MPAACPQQGCIADNSHICNAGSCSKKERRRIFRQGSFIDCNKQVLLWQLNLFSCTRLQVSNFNFKYPLPCVQYQTSNCLTCCIVNVAPKMHERYSSDNAMMSSSDQELNVILNRQLRAFKESKKVIWPLIWVFCN